MSSQVPVCIRRRRKGHPQDTCVAAPVSTLSGYMVSRVNGRFQSEPCVSAEPAQRKLLTNLNSQAFSSPTKPQEALVL